MTQIYTYQSQLARELRILPNQINKTSHSLGRFLYQKYNLQTTEYYIHFRQKHIILNYKNIFQ